MGRTVYAGRTAHQCQLVAKELRAHDLETEKVAKKTLPWRNRVLKFNSMQTPVFPNVCCFP